MPRILAKRDFDRVKVNTAMSLRYGTPPKEVQALCCDLSSSGIGVEVSIVIPIGTQCHVNIYDGHENTSKFQALIEITRVSSISDERYRLGAVILQQY